MKKSKRKIIEGCKNSSIKSNYKIGVQRCDVVYFGYAKHKFCSDDLKNPAKVLTMEDLLEK
jgi:hypothetical protein